MQIDQDVISQLKSLNMDEEIAVINEYVRNACVLVEEMTYDGGDFEKTNVALSALRDGELTQGGRIYNYIRDYEGLFGKGNNYSIELSSYSKYWNEFNILWAFCEDLCLMLQNQTKWLEYGFDLLKAKSNFEKAGYTKDLFTSINKDLLAVYSFTNRYLSSEAKLSKEVFRDGKTDEEFRKAYDAAREQDYANLFRANLSPESFTYEMSSKRFSMNPKRAAQVDTLDDYTFRVAEIKDCKSDIKNTIDHCDSLLARKTEGITIPSCQELLRLLVSLVTLTQNFAKLCLEIYENFMSGKDEAPYCFMKKLPALNDVHGYELDNLIKEDPTKYGTFYRDTYTKMVESLAEARYDFINCEGIFVKDKKWCENH